MKRLKPNYGYWAMDSYPIGGDFRRAPKEGKLIVSIESMKMYKGCNATAQFADGTKGAFNLEDVETAPCACGKPSQEGDPRCNDCHASQVEAGESATQTQ